MQSDILRCRVRPSQMASRTRRRSPATTASSGLPSSRSRTYRSSRVRGESARTRRPGRAAPCPAGRPRAAGACPAASSSGCRRRARTASVGRQEELERGVGEHAGADVPPLHDAPRSRPEPLLARPRASRRTRRNRRHGRGVEGDLGLPDRLARRRGRRAGRGCRADVGMSSMRGPPRRAPPPPPGRRSAAAMPRSRAAQADGAVHGPGVDVGDAEPDARGRARPWTCPRRTGRRSRRSGAARHFGLREALQRLDLRRA